MSPARTHVGGLNLIDYRLEPGIEMLLMIETLSAQKYILLKECTTSTIVYLDAKNCQVKTFLSIKHVKSW